MFNFQVQGQGLTVSSFYFFVLLFKLESDIGFAMCMESYEKMFVLSDLLLSCNIFACQ